jgi:predicted transcriptional regulator of viral defense system
MPGDAALVQKLLSLRKPYFSVADLEKLLGRQRPALYVTLNRLVHAGVLVRLRRGAYQVALQPPALARVANTLVYPSYLSFESALSRYGILSQVPYTLTFATPLRSRRLMLGDTAVEFHQLKDELFFGYVLADGLYVAEPEKALLDQLYLVSRGLATLALDELELASLDRARLREHAARFPAAVQASVERDVLTR